MICLKFLINIYYSSAVDVCPVAKASQVLNIFHITIEMIAEDAIQMLCRSQALRFFQYDVISN